MNPEIEFWAIRSTAGDIQKLLAQFEAEHRIHVRVRLLDWDTAWAELMKVALYKHGPDVCEIGSTWLGDLVTMNALHPLSSRDINRIGSSWSFINSAWQSTRLAGEPETWAIPWMTEARLLFYRRAWIEKAGLDPHDAFRNSQAFVQSLAALAACGAPVPWVIPTEVTRAMLHNAASWMWSAGGDFISPDGKHVVFNSDQARAGLREHFSLGRYLAPAVHRLGSIESDQRFAQDSNAAIALAGPWILRMVDPGALSQIDLSMPPVPSFVGGSHLVIWKHSSKIELVLKFVAFLSNTQQQVDYSVRIGHLPATLSALASAPFSTDPLWQMAAHSLHTGRTFPATRSWGLIEDRLATEFGAIWEKVFADPDLDLDAVLKERLDTLAEQIDPLLSQPQS
ncbi:MAG: extracellular solute-binding protein [Anaerolineae bacterium]